MGGKPYISPYLPEFTLWFTVFADILKRVHLDENSTVILAGMSAGGVAALYWADYFK